MVEGKPDVSRISEIDLDDLARRFRMQTIVFQTAREVFDQMAPTWSGGRRGPARPARAAGRGLPGV